MWLNVATRRPELTWQKSSRCQSSDCVEIASADGYVILRSTAQPRRKVRYTLDEWRVFVEGIRAGDFRDLA
jgi:hypothetical protein